MKSNNQYYISIYETVTGTPVIGHKSDNYLLKGIAECYGYSYTGSKCDFYYLRDISHSITGITYTEFYDNNRYLQDIADAVYDGTLTSKRNNYLLRIISENITQPVPPTPTPTATNLDVKINGATPDPQTPTILSYADGDNAVFTFLATDDNDNPVSDYEIGYSIDGQTQTPLSTDENGEATFTYQSSGNGDIDIGINCTLLTKTYAIRDVHFYDSMTSDSGHWTYDSGITKSYSSDGVSITANSDKYSVCDVALPTNFRLSLKAKSNTNNDLRYCVIGTWIISNGTYNSVPKLMIFNIWPPQYYINNSYTQPNVVEFEAEYNNGVLTVKKDGTTITQSLTLADQVLKLSTGANRTITIKDIIVEEL